MRAALIQLCSGDVPSDNLPPTADLIRRAAGQGARFVLTPEVTNCVSGDRAHQEQVLQKQGDDLTLAGLSSLANELGIWISIGSLALKSDDPDGRFVNRSFMLSPQGQITATYDKIHMFDVAVSETETYRESAGYRPGNAAIRTDIEEFRVGLTICYDVRFPALYRSLAQAGASVLTVPSAFSQVTGAAHWETLLRARAIENGAYVLAAAQTGPHPASTAKTRKTYGHSLAVSPWGQVLADGGTEPGITLVDLDPQTVKDARRRIPSLTHDQTISGP